MHLRNLSPLVQTPSTALHLRVLLVLLACWWSLAGVGHAARFYGSLDEWQIDVGGKGRPSLRRVLAEVDAFAKHHGFVRHPEQEFSGNNYTLDHITYLPVQERSYSIQFDPAKKSPRGEVRLTLTHNGNEPYAELRILGPPDQRAWQHMERWRDDFLREFPARYGKRHVRETSHLYVDHY